MDDSLEESDKISTCNSCSMQYLFAVVLIVVLEIVAGILGFVYRDQVVSSYACSCVNVYTCTAYITCMYAYV